MKINLLVDCSNIFYRSYFTLKLYNKDFNLDTNENQVELIRKFCIDLVSISNQFKPTASYLCFDSHSFRYDLLDNYKGGRSEKEENFKKVLEDVRILFERKKYNVLKCQDLEADDLIAICTENLDGTNIIVSADEDTYQLASKNTCVYKPVKSQRKITCTDKFDLNSISIPTDCKIEKIIPEYILLEKVIKGCSGDKIPKLIDKIMSKKLMELTEKLISNKKQLDFFNTYDFEDKIRLLLKDANIHLSADEVFERLCLVCLNSNYAPADSVKMVQQSLKVLSKNDKKLGMNNITEDTKYYG